MKTNHKTRKYGPCESCGGEVIERELTVDRRFRGKLHEFENVPVGVCRECGQRIFKGPVLERMQRLVTNGARVKKTLRVPVREYRPA
jgi:YgiT-type zinc finger domain-containing protein